MEKGPLSAATAICPASSPSPRGKPPSRRRSGRATPSRRARPAGEGPAAQRHDLGRVPQRQRPRDARGGDLALRVPDDGGRARRRSARHTAASETITANRAGCTTSTRSSVGAPSAPRSTSVSDQSVNSRERLLALGDAARRTPASCRSRSRPCPATASPGRGRRTPRPATAVPAAAAGSPPAATASRAASSSSRSAPATTARCSNAGPQVGQRPADIGRPAASGSAAVRGQRSGLRPQRRGRCGRTAPRGHGGRVGRGCGLFPRRPRSGRGACSRMTWALVPLMPKEETPARRGRSAVAATGVAPVSSAPRRSPSRRAGWARRRAGSRAAGRAASP